MDTTISESEYTYSICLLGFQSKEGIQEAGQISLNEISQKKITKVLNDNSEVIGHWHGTSDWTQQVW